MQFLKQATFITLLVTLWSVALALSGCSTLPQPTQQVPAAPPPNLQASFLSVPLSFEANQGQTDPEVKFFTRGPGYGLFLTPNEAVLALTHLQPPVSTPSDSPADEAVNEPAVLRMHLIGANPTPTLAGETALPGKVNYFIGNDPNKWESNIPIYGRVRYDNVYPGIDLVYYGNQQQLEYDFVVGPGQDPQHIAIRFEGVTRLELDQNGDLLLLQTEDGVIRQQKPFIYQDVDGKRQIIDGGYVINTEGQVGFQVAAYDVTKPLIIDPILVFSTFLGGAGNDNAYGIAVDNTGQVYVAGETSSLDFPTNNPLQATRAGLGDAYIAKLAADGSALIYATYLGGSGGETALSIAVDGTGHAYVTGETGSPDFPTKNAVQPIHGNGNSPFADAFVVKLAPDGSNLAYATFLGGLGHDVGRNIAVDATGQAYLTGITSSLDFPTTVTAFQSTRPGDNNAFVVKLTQDGSALAYATYLGGSSIDVGNDIAIDEAGQATVTGSTGSTDFPTQNPLQPVLLGSSDAFVAQLTADGSALTFSTYLGGSDSDGGVGIAVDGSGQVYITGYTSSPDFPTKNPAQPSYGNGRGDAFVAKLASDGSALTFATFLGGTGFEEAGNIAVDREGHAWITGSTFSPDFPTANPLQPALHSNVNVFVTEFLTDGSALKFSTFLGGTGGAQGKNIAVDSEGQIYITGSTVGASTTHPTPTFPIKFALQPTLGGLLDAFIAKINPQVNNLNNKFAPLGSGQVSTAFSRTPCGGATAGTFTVTATFTNISADTLSNLVIQVNKLTGGNVLCNADGGPDGAGALFTIPLLGSFTDSQLSPNEAFTVAFQIGLQSFNPFQFVVDVLGEEIP